MVDVRLYPAKSEKERWIERKDGIIILNPETKLYHRLNLTATYIWQILCNGIRTVEEISKVNARKYKISQARASRDTSAIIEYLKKAGIIKLYRSPKRFYPPKNKIR
jgi:hypothetical protein